MPQGVGVQIPPGAPYFPGAPIVYRLGHQVLILERGVRLPLGVPFIKANVAQLVEQIIRNDQVVRSIRIVGSICLPRKSNVCCFRGFCF